MEIHTQTTWHERLQDEGTWDRVKGKIREQWGDLTDDEIDQTEGKWDRLVGTIKEKTGEAREAIEEKLGQMTDGGDQPR